MRNTGSRNPFNVGRDAYRARARERAELELRLIAERADQARADERWVIEGLDHRGTRGSHRRRNSGRRGFAYDPAVRVEGSGKATRGSKPTRRPFYHRVHDRRRRERAARAARRRNRL